VTGQSRPVNQRLPHSSRVGRFQPRGLHKHLLRGSQLDRSALRQEIEQLHQAWPWSGLGCVGPTTPRYGTRADMRLATTGKVVRRAFPKCELHHRPGYTPFDLLIQNPASRFGDGPRGPARPGARDEQRPGRLHADDPEDGGRNVLARQGPVERHAQRVPLDPQEMGEVGRRHPRRATAAQGHPRVPRPGLRASRQG
jgi:hypothetical protein